MGEIKRYVAEIDFYVYGENDVEAMSATKEILRLVLNHCDNHASIIRLTDQGFGSLAVREVPLTIKK